MVAKSFETVAGHRSVVKEIGIPMPWQCDQRALVNYVSPGGHGFACERDTAVQGEVAVQLDDLATLGFEESKVSTLVLQALFLKEDRLLVGRRHIGWLH